MDNRTFVIIAILLLCGFASCNRPESTPTNAARTTIGMASADDPQDKETALKILLVTDEFASSAVGYGGNLSDQVRAYRAVAQDPHAEEAFAYLLAHGNLEGQLYALCGLYACDRSTFDREISSYLNRPGNAKVFMGCIKTELPITTIAKEIASGGWPRDFEQQSQDGG